MIKCYSFTLAPTGADGAAVATKRLGLAHGGMLRAISVDYQNQPVTTDIVVYDGDDNTGEAMFTLTSTNTDVPKTVLTTENAKTEDNTGATANAGFGGIPFERNIFVDLAQGDGQTSGNEKVVMRLWVER